MVGNRIKELRKSKKLSQSELGNLIGQTGASIMRYEKGKRKPSKEIIEKIAEVLEVSPSTLFGWEEFDKKYSDMGNEVKRFESFICYLESIGYLYHSNIDELNDSYEKDEKDDNGNIAGHSTIIEDAIYSITLSKDGITSIFTEEEFKALQDKNKEALEGAILLQSQKNKKEPPSDKTESGSD